MTLQPSHKRLFAITAIALSLVGTFLHVALQKGPLAPVPVTVESVRTHKLAPALYGLGTVDAKHVYRVGPIAAGRLKSVVADVGDRVQKGQIIGEMDAVDLNEKILSQEAALARSKASIEEARARNNFAESQHRRYQNLLAQKLTSEEAASVKSQEYTIASAALVAATAEYNRIKNDRNALQVQLNNLQLVSPANGIIIARETEPGATVIAGQTVFEIVSPEDLWVNARFDQVGAAGLAANLPASITLRSRHDQSLAAAVARVEPKADAVTEEILAKVAFKNTPSPLPTLGELAEVTVQLPELAPGLVISNSSLRKVGDATGVWKLEGENVRFSPVIVRATDLEGNVLIESNLNEGDRIIRYSEKPISNTTHVLQVSELTGAKQ